MHLTQRRIYIFSASLLSEIELTSAIPVAEVGEPPDVSEPDSKTEAGEEELDGVVPAASVLVHRRVFTEVVVRNLFQAVILGEACLCLQMIKSLAFIKCFSAAQ